ncbi:hypothetical protein Clacol_005321 [Clathrus columnatus]|uniref:Uncharacterized protein n=1 Tax=Clathrus columnatus TaxID=1419009 RepID=A0AAV5ADU9_9AGAM|nr:hypothetical protein Clacol_005321 [Clathrus columnatus]
MFWECDPYDRDDIIDREFHPDHLLPSPSPTYSSEDETNYDSPYPIPKDSDFPPILYPTQPSYHPFQTELQLYVDLGEKLDIRISPTTAWPALTPTKTYHKDLEDLEIMETLHYARPIKPTSPIKPHTTISPQPPKTQTMFSFNVTTQNISTNSRSSSSYTSQFHYQPPPDSETDDQVPTTCPTTPLPSPIEDLETEVRISDLGLPETIKYGDAISIKGFEGQYHINHYFTVSRYAPPYQIIRIIATASLGITFEHIGFDVLYECVLPYSSLPYHSRYIFIPFEEVFFTPPCLYPEDHFYSSFPVPTPLPTPPINKVLRKIRSYAIGVLKGKNQSLAEEKCLKEGLRKFQNHSDPSLVYNNDEPGDQPEFVAVASGGGGDPNNPDGDDDGNPGNDADRPDLASPHNNQPQGGGSGPPSDPDDFDDDNYVNQESDVVRIGDFREALNNIAAILESQQSIQTQQIARCIKVKEPETFNGTSFEKLANFITQCQLAFQANPNDFLEDWQ